MANQFKVKELLLSGKKVTADNQYIYLNDNPIASKSELNLTGSSLDQKINSVSGYVVNALPNYALQSNLAITGSTLDQKINSLSGYSYSPANPDAILFTTGTQNIVGIKQISSGLDFINSSNPSYSEGRVFYDSGTHSLAYYNDNSQMTVNLAQETIVRVSNRLGFQIDNGTVIYVSGSNGNLPAAYLPIANNSNAHYTAGVTTTDIPDQGNGYMTVRGFVNGINTNAFTEGDILYLSSSVSGGLTNTIPSAPNHNVRIGICTKKAANGSIYVNPHVASDLDHLNDVAIINPANGDIIIYDSTSGFWKNIPNFSGVLKSDIASTGSTLDSKINNYSGFIANNPSGYATAVNLALTGSNLQSQINNITVSNVVYTTGNQTISGSKTFATIPNYGGIPFALSGQNSQTGYGKQILAALGSGQSYHRINFSQAFNSVPYTVLATLTSPSGYPIPAYQVTSIDRSGYYLETTATLSTTGYSIMSVVIEGSFGVGSSNTLPWGNIVGDITGQVDLQASFDAANAFAVAMAAAL